MFEGEIFGERGKIYMTEIIKEGKDGLGWRLYFFNLY